MKFSVVLPFILITAIWSIYNGISQGQDGLINIIPFAIGTIIGYVGIPYGIALITVRKTSMNDAKKRFNVFLIIWCILIFSQVIVHFHEM